MVKDHLKEEEMRIAIINKKGIEAMVKDYFSAKPINKRLDEVSQFTNRDPTNDGHPKYDETHPTKIQVIKPETHYQIGEKQIDLIGPLEDVPSKLIVSDEESKKRILTKDALESPFQQNQLIVLEKGIYFRNLQKKPYHPDELRILNAEHIHFGNGFCFFPNANQNPYGRIKAPAENELDYNHPDKNLGIGRSLVWEQAIESMITYFVQDQYWIKGPHAPNPDAHKIIYESNRCKDIIVKTLDRM